MQLVHFSRKPLKRVHSARQEDSPSDKPCGIWLSDESQSHSWTDFCFIHSCFVNTLKHATRFVLRRRAKILRIKSDKELKEFGNFYRDPLLRKRDLHAIRWNEVAEDYGGIIISPYRHSCRNDLDNFWYATWDVASGCIWDKDTISRIESLPIEQFTKPAMEDLI